MRKLIAAATAVVAVTLGMATTSHAAVSPARVFNTALVNLGEVKCPPQSTVVGTPVATYSIVAKDPEFKFVRLVIMVNGKTGGVYEYEADAKVHTVVRVESRGAHVQACVARGGARESGPHRLLAGAVTLMS